MSITTQPELLERTESNMQEITGSVLHIHIAYDNFPVLLENIHQEEIWGLKNQW